jgi:hypothetical protein
MLPFLGNMDADNWHRRAMDLSNVSAFNALLIAWGILTGVLVLLLIYRSIVSMKEEGQVFLDPAEANLEAEQQLILKRLEKVDRYVKSFGIAAGSLLIVIAGIWLYRGITGFVNPTLER